MLDEKWYLAQYSDVKVSKIPPTVHYEKYGQDEGRLKNPPEYLNYLFKEKSWIYGELNEEIKELEFLKEFANLTDTEVYERIKIKYFYKKKHELEFFKSICFKIINKKNYRLNIQKMNKNIDKHTLKILLDNIQKDFHIIFISNYLVLVKKLVYEK